MVNKNWCIKWFLQQSRLGLSQNRRGCGKAFFVRIVGSIVKKAKCHLLLFLLVRYLIGSTAPDLNSAGQTALDKGIVQSFKSLLSK